MKDKEVRSQLKSIYGGIKNRCYNHNSDNYKYYGGRGIIMCDEWLNNFSSFVSWSLDNGYQRGLTIDRKNTNGNYNPENCKWATMIEQCNNRRNNLYFEHEGAQMTIPQISRLVGLPIMCLRSRLLKQNLSLKESIALGPYDKNSRRKKEKV